MQRPGVWRFAITLGCLALAGRAHAQEGWAVTFSPQSLYAVSVPVQSVIVIPAGDQPERTAAASAFLAALRASGRASLVMDASAIGDVAALDDPTIIARAQSSPAATIAIVRVFPGTVGGAASVVVAFYDKSGQPLGAVSGERGAPLTAATAQPPAPPPVAQPFYPPRLEVPVPTPELTQQPGTVPMNFVSVSNQLQLSVYDGGTTVYGGYNNAYALGLLNFRNLCQTPCTLYLRPGTAQQLRVDGYGIRPYLAAVTVPPAGADLRLRAPSASGYHGGYLLTTSGGGFVVSGIILLVLYHYDQNTTFTSDAFGNLVAHHSGNQGYLIGGGILTGIGGAMLVGGIALLAVNSGGVASVTSHASSTRPTAKLLMGPSSLTVRGTF